MNKNIIEIAKIIKQKFDRNCTIDDKQSHKSILFDKIFIETGLFNIRLKLDNETGNIIKGEIFCDISLEKVIGNTQKTQYAVCYPTRNYLEVMNFTSIEEFENNIIPSLDASIINNESLKNKMIKNASINHKHNIYFDKDITDGLFSIRYFENEIKLVSPYSASLDISLDLSLEEIFKQIDEYKEKATLHRHNKANETASSIVGPIIIALLAAGFVLFVMTLG